MHPNALAIGTDHQPWLLAPRLGLRRWRLRITGIAVLAQLHGHRLGLALGHLPATGACKMRHRLIEAALEELLYQHLPQAMGALVRRRIPGRHALQPPPPIAPAGDHHLPAAALPTPLAACAPVRPAASILTHHALVHRLLGAALVQIPLGQAAPQLVAFGVHQRLHFPVRQPLSRIVHAPAEQVLKVGNGVGVVLDGGGGDGISSHGRGLLGHGA
jgi:hypothetical protein